jgi:hypothetical protein
MRRHTLIFLLAGSTAIADPATKRPSDKPHAIDVKPVADKLSVLRDDLGNYYVVPRVGAFASSDEAGAWLFYGDGKTMYQQRLIGQSSDDHKYEWDVWSPRAKGMQAAEIATTADQSSVECKVRDGKRPLTALKADEAKLVLTRATFLPPLWTRVSHFLARDDDAVYYFVDQLREELGGNGFRVFVGPKGSMKELGMLNVASDSGGEIFATKTGQLKIVAGKDGKAYWSKGGKQVDLTVLVPGDNRYLIYRDLGIYGQLGVVCDDL